LAKKITIPVLKIIVSFSLVFLLFYKLGFNNVIAQVLAVNFYWFFGGIIIFVISNILGSYQWQLLLKARDIELRLAKITAFYFTGLFFNNFLVGYIGGDAIRIYDITKATGRNTEAISTVFLDRFIGFMMLTTLALGAAIYWIDLFASSKILLTILSLFSCWVLLFFLLFNEKLMEKVTWLIKFMLPENVKAKIRGIYTGINEFKNHKKILVKVFLLSLITQMLRILVHYVTARSIGVNLNIMYFIIFIPIIALISSLPISIGGIGVRESSAVALFSQIWPVQADIVAFEFFAFLIGVISALPGGIIFMLRRENNQPLTEGELVK